MSYSSFQVLKPNDKVILNNNNTSNRIMKAKKIKFGIKANIFYDTDTSLYMQKRLITLADQCINQANLKSNLLDIIIIDHSNGLDLDCVLVPFYHKLRRHGPFLKYLKLNLNSLASYNIASPNYKFETWNAIKLPFSKLTNLKGLNLDIRMINWHKIVQKNALNDLYASIESNLSNLKSFRMKINGNIFDERSRYTLKGNWDFLKTQKNLEGFNLELVGKNISCSRANLTSLLTIPIKHPNLKRFYITFDSRNLLINDSPLQNLSKYFLKLNTLESLKLDIPIKGQHLHISNELIKLLMNYCNLKEIYLACGDKSYGFRDKLAKIIECLGKLTQLQNLTIKYKFEDQRTLIQLANMITQMKKLEKLKLYMEYIGLKPSIFNDFMASLQLSMPSLKHLFLRIKSRNSGITHIFWELITKSLSNNTLESFDLFIIIRNITINNNFQAFVNKLSENSSLSKLRLALHANYKYDGSELIYLAKIIKSLKYINQLTLDYQNVDNINEEYFDILQNSLKQKHLTLLRVYINYELKRFAFPITILNDIMKLINNHNHMTLNEIHLKIQIHSLIQFETNKILNIINNKQIHGLKLELEEYNFMINNIYQRYIIQSIQYAPKLNYELSIKTLNLVYNDFFDTYFF